jgi:hypothetical protein
MIILLVNCVPFCPSRHRGIDCDDRAISSSHGVFALGDDTRRLIAAEGRFACKRAHLPLFPILNPVSPVSPFARGSVLTVGSFRRERIQHRRTVSFLTV